MIRKFTIETGGIDNNGNRIDLNGLTFPPIIPLIENFNNKKIIGSASIFKEDGMLKAVADIPSEFLDSYPAVGVKSLEILPDYPPFTIIKSRLCCVSLSAERNADHRIKTIAEQANQKSSHPLL